MLEKHEGTDFIETRSRRTYNDWCGVTFTTPVNWKADTVFLVGDFNDWNKKSHPMYQRKDGTWRTSLKLSRNRKYQFRYLAYYAVWSNDPEADDYAQNPFGGDNSVVAT